MGREVASWLEQYLGKEGFRLLYMSPRHRGRQLMDDNVWSDVCTEEYEVVYYLCGKAGTSHLCDGSAHSSGCVVNGSNSMAAF